jgi:hypothetical protein
MKIIIPFLCSELKQAGTGWCGGLDGITVEVPDQTDPLVWCSENRELIKTKCAERARAVHAAMRVNGVAELESYHDADRLLEKQQELTRPADA